MVNYEPIYDINGTWEVHFNLPKMIDQKLLDQYDEIWKKIKLTFTNKDTPKLLTYILQ